MTITLRDYKLYSYGYFGVILSLLLLLPCRTVAALLVGDVNGDGRVSMADVTMLEKCIVTPSLYYGGVEYVDFELPSGLLWATTNVGATKAEGYGNHYAWGETAVKDNYDWSTYSLCGGTSATITKYCTSSSYGTVDNLSTLEPADDVAHITTGCAWHIPSISDWLEIVKYCTVSEDHLNAVYGCYLICNQDRSKRIFLPYSGYRSADYIYNEGIDACYWANGLYPYNSSTGYGYYIGDSYKGWAYRSRYLGNPVRPVIYPYETVCDINGDGSVDSNDVDALIKQTLILGDANDDGSVTVSDLSAIVGYILGTNVVSNFAKYNADANQDGEITVSDLSTVVGIILGK